jgi:hypothetical protein
MPPAKLTPVPWPPHDLPCGGTKDSFVPVLRGRERVLWCIYLAASEHGRCPTKIACAHSGLRRTVRAGEARAPEDFTPKEHRRAHWERRPWGHHHRQNLSRQLHEDRKYGRRPRDPSRRCDDLALFWSAWFQWERDADDVERLVRYRLRAEHQIGKWYDVAPEVAREIIVSAAHDLRRKFLPHDKFVNCCRWRRTLPIECRLPRTWDERESMTSAALSARRMTFGLLD